MIVSCYYTNLLSTKFGGRPISFKRRYLDGIARMATNNLNKVIYTSSHDESELKEHLKNKLSEESLEKFEIKIFELEDQKYHSTIQRLKDINGYINDRCLEIQYGKFDFLLNEIKLNKEEKYFWWIDAGLIDKHLFTNKIIDNLNVYNVLNDNFFNTLKLNIVDKLFFICGDRDKGYLHKKPSTKFFSSNYQGRLHTIGGFFGGESNNLIKFCENFNKKVSEVLNQDTLYSEEMIMEIIFSENIKDCVYKTFVSWRHEDSKKIKDVKEDNKFLNSKESFYKCFLF